MFSWSHLQITCNSRETLFKQPRVLHKETTYLFACKSRCLIVCVWSTELIQKGCSSKRFLIPFLKPFDLVSHTFSSIRLLTTCTCSVGYHMTYCSNWWYSLTLFHSLWWCLDGASIGLFLCFLCQMQKGCYNCFTVFGFAYKIKKKFNEFYLCWRRLRNMSFVCYIVIYLYDAKNASRELNCIKKVKPNFFLIIQENNLWHQGIKVCISKYLQKICHL